MQVRSLRSGTLVRSSGKGCTTVTQLEAFRQVCDSWALSPRTAKERPDRLRTLCGGTVWTQSCYQTPRCSVPWSLCRVGGYLKVGMWPTPTELSNTLLPVTQLAVLPCKLHAPVLQRWTEAKLQWRVLLAAAKCKQFFLTATARAFHTGTDSASRESDHSLAWVEVFTGHSSLQC